MRPQKCDRSQLLSSHNKLPGTYRRQPHWCGRARSGGQIGSEAEDANNDCKARCAADADRSFWKPDSNFIIGGSCVEECSVGTVAGTAYKVCAMRYRVN